jgi:CBS domain-containing protein
MRASDPSCQPEAVAAFLRTVPPFDLLAPRDLLELAATSRVAFFLAGETVVASGREGPGVGCVQRGGLRLSLGEGDAPETLLDYRGEGECFGVAWALDRTPADCWVRAELDTFLVLLDPVVLVAVAGRHPFLAAAYKDALGALSQPAHVAGSDPGAPSCREHDGDFLLTRHVGAVSSHALVSARRGMSLRQAARIMEDGQVGSVLVRETSGAVIGIVTDRDLRRAVADGLGLTAPVETLMSAPVADVAAEASCFEALTRMTEAGIRHLAVRRDGDICGMVTANDLLLAHGRSPMALLRAIRRAANFEEAATLCARTRDMAAALVARGATAGAVAGILTMVAERVLARLVELLTRACGPSPAPYCLLALDQAGRGELLPGSGLALAMVADDGGDAIVARAARTYMDAVADRLRPHLERCGLAQIRPALSLVDPGNRTSLDLFISRRRALLGNPDLSPDDPLLGLFDARPVAGDRTLAMTVRRRLADSLAGTPVLARLRRYWSRRPVPLAVFQGRLAERDGCFGPVLDLADRASGPLAAMARIATLEHGLAETGTDARLARLGQEGHLPRDVAEKARQAFAFFERLRLVGRLESRPDEDGGPETADRIGIAGLPPLQRRALTAGFDAVLALARYLGATGETP